MANPGELLRNAAWSKKWRPAKPVQAKREVQQALPERQEQVPQPFRRLPGGHSAYSAIMRSHDRVHPRIGS